MAFDVGYRGKQQNKHAIVVDVCLAAVFLFKLCDDPGWWLDSYLLLYLLLYYLYLGGSNNYSVVGNPCYVSVYLTNK